MTRLDDEIRSRMRAEAVSTRATSPASTVLRELQPRLRTARRMRRAAIGAMGGVVLIGGTSVALQAGLTDRSSTMIRAAEESEPIPEVDHRTPGGTDDRAVTTDPGGSAQSGAPAVATVVAEPSTSSSAPMPTRPGIGGDDRPVAPIPGLTPTATTPPDTTVSIDTAAESSTSISSVPPAWSPYRIDSACGSVDVRFFGDDVELVEVWANAGFAIDIKNDGPEQVEVGLHGGDDECELKARVVGGELVTTANGPGDPGSDEHEGEHEHEDDTSTTTE